MKKIIGSVLLSLAALAAGAAEKLVLEVRPDRPQAMYACGETATFVVKVADTNGVPLKAGKVTTVLDNFGPHIIAATNEVDLAKGNPFTVSGSLAEPGFLRLVLRSDLAGFPTTQYQKDEWFASVGFEPEKLRPAAACPEDFDAFWARGREEVAKVPLDAKVEPSAEWSDAKWDVWGVSFATLGGRRVYGWLAKEKGAEGRLPVIVQVAAAGFGGWSQNPRKTPGYLNLFMTVFPFPPDAETQKPAYEKLSADCKAKWGVARYATAGIASDDPRDFYYYPVILGIDRAIDWVAAREDADPGNFVYDGTSQGGGFGFYCVGLNRHFTKGVFHVPALTDHSSHRAGRFDGWPQFLNEQTTAAGRAAVERNAPYYDGVNFARRIRVPVTVICGTADAACHPHCVWTAYNQIPGKDKRIMTGFAMPHGEWGHFYSRTAAWLKDDGAAVSAPEEGHVTISDKPRAVSEDPKHWWRKALEYRDNEAKEKCGADVVWLGDSITHYFDNPENQPLWRKWFGGKACGAPYLGLNFGIEGDTTDNLLFRMRHSLGKVRPKAIVLLIGTNNAGKRSEKAETPEDTVKGLKAIIDELRRTQPQATVLVYALFPRGKGVTDPCMVRNEKVNAALEKLCDGRQFVFRNINDAFLRPDGTVNANLLGDRLHPSCEGYEVWLGDVLPQLRKIFGDFPRAEADIRFPETLADLGVKEGRSVEADSFGWDAKNATKCLQAAIDSGATTVHVRPQEGPWYIDSVQLRSNLRLVFHRGVKVLMDKDSPKANKECLFRVTDCENVILEGEGTDADGSYLGGYASYEERKACCRDYGKSVIMLANARNTVIRNLRLAESAEDGIFFGGLGRPSTETFVDNVVIDSHFRQAMSICNADGVYCRRVQFLNTRGNAPTTGIDFEPPLENLLNTNVYLFDCTFANNDGGGLMFATSTYAPIRVCVRRTRFLPHRAPLLELMPRLGIYLAHRTRIPSELVFEDCAFETCLDEPAINIANGPFLTYTLRNCTIRATAEKADMTRKYVSTPIRLTLARDFGAEGIPAEMVAAGTFENVTCEGYPAGTPAVGVADVSGTVDVRGAFKGTLEMNGEAVDLSKFAYVAPDRGEGEPKPVVLENAGVRYFEVPAGGAACEVRMIGGSLELRDPAGNVVERVREGDYLGRHAFAIRPSSDKAEIWSFRQPPRSGRATLKFRRPLTGETADSPKALTCRFGDHYVPVKRAHAADISWGDPIDVECDVTKPLVDRAKLSAADAKALDEEIARRAAFAEKKEWTRRFEKETALLRRLKETAKTDGELHDIEMESLNLPPLERNAEAERTAAAENANVRELAAFCSVFKGRLAPGGDEVRLAGELIRFGLSLAPKTGELEYDDVRKLVLLRDAICYNK